MSGWDTPSRPTWDPQDGPEDSTQAFPAPDGSGADDRWSQPVGPGWGGSGADDDQDFGRADFGAPDFGGLNTPGVGRRRLRLTSAGLRPRDRRGVRHRRRAGLLPPGVRAAQARRDPGRPRPARDGAATGRGRRPPRGTSRRGRAPRARNPRARSPPALTTAAPASTAAGDDYGRGRISAARALDRCPDRPGAPGQDFPRRDPGRARLLRLTPRTPASRIRPSRRPRRRTEADAELAARMDPALQDFFAPTKPDPRYSAAAAEPGRPAAGTARPRPVRPRPAGPGPVSPARCGRTRAGAATPR